MMDDGVVASARQQQIHCGLTAHLVVSNGCGKGAAGPSPAHSVKSDFFAAAEVVNKTRHVVRPRDGKRTMQLEV